MQANNSIVFNWRKVDDGVPGGYEACLIEVAGGQLIQYLLARCQRVEVATDPPVEVRERAEYLGEDDELTAEDKWTRPRYYSALDIVALRQVVRFRGALAGEKAPELPKFFLTGKLYLPDDEDEPPEGSGEDGEEAMENCLKLMGPIGVHNAVFDDFKRGAENRLWKYIQEFQKIVSEDAHLVEDLVGGDVLSVTEVASRLSVGRNTVLNWIRTGKLPAFRMGSKWMIHSAELARAKQNSIGWAAESRPETALSAEEEE